MRPLKPPLTGLLISVVAITLGISYGFSFGVGDHLTYLLGSLRLTDPSLLANDWRAAEAADYHPTFTYIGWALLELDSSGWAFAMANVVVIAIGAVILYRIVAALVEGEYRLPTYLALMACITITRTYSASLSYLFAWILTPAMIGALGFLGGILFFLRQRYLLSSLSLAVGGFFHTNYLILTFPAFLLAHLLLGGKAIVQRALLQLTLPACVLSLFLPIILRTAASEDAAAARKIFFEIISPYHYLPIHQEGAFLAFFAWVLIGLSAGGWNTFRERDRQQHLRALFLSFLIIVSGGTLATTVVYIPVVAQLFVWRLAPIVVILCQLMAVHALLLMLRHPDKKLPIGLYRQIAILVGMSVIWVYFFARVSLHSPGWAPITTLFLGALLTLWASRRSQFSFLAKPQSAIPITLTLWAMANVHPMMQIRDQSSLLRKQDVQHTSLFAWVRTNTPKDAIFLIPPNLKLFRFHAQRGVIIDEWATPIVANDILEWNERMKTVSGRKELKHKRDATVGYFSMDEQRLAEIHRRYPFRYFVLKKDESDLNAIRQRPVVYENDTFVIYPWAREQ